MGGVDLPVMRYLGSKWRLAPWIISYFPPHLGYVEPYGGGASVLLRKARCGPEIYNDLDADIVNVFKVLRDAPQAERLREVCRLTPWAIDELRTPPGDDPVDRARHFIFRSFAGAGPNNGAGAGGKSVHLATCINRDRDNAATWADYGDRIPALVERLRRVQIENQPATHIIKRYAHEPDTLFYVDPPYAKDTRRDSHYERDMDDDDHRELAKLLREIDRDGGLVVLSGYHNELYDDLYAGWQRIDKDCYTNLPVHGKTKRTESLWVSWRAATLPAQRELF